MDKHKSIAPHVMLITGTSKGIGLELANHYLNEGFLVAGCSRSETNLLHANYYHEQVDITREDELIKFVKNVKKQFGSLDIVINNAGIASMNHVMLTPYSTLEQIFKSNVFAAFIMIREASKIMSRVKNGRIINISSVASALDIEGESAYAASKAALESLTRISARELASLGITVNAIGPTPYDTALIRTVSSEKISNLLQRQAIKRKAEFNDIANVIDFFIKPESSFITGQIIYLGGVS